MFQIHFIPEMPPSKNNETSVISTVSEFFVKILTCTDAMYLNSAEFIRAEFEYLVWHLYLYTLSVTKHGWYHKWLKECFQVSAINHHEIGVINTNRFYACLMLLWTGRTLINFKLYMNATFRMFFKDKFSFIGLLQ